MKKNILKLPKMSSNEINQLIDNENISRIAFHGEEYPYLAPFQYIRMGDSLYFHFTDYGKKMKLLQKDHRVCVSIENLSPDMSKYSFVSFRGELEQVNDNVERANAIKRLSEKGSENLSENFLAAHGFKAEEGWESLSHEKPIVIYKLKTISETTGLKSP
jgi:nitroimidazol reductase NimA-like FMN-containing flavoprotein (pyridoxamine 5'-phosphate oxidase superfamily)